MAKKLAFDKLLFGAVALLAGFGLVMVYSASAALARDRAAGINPFLLKQSIAGILGLIAMAVVMHIDYRVLRRVEVVYGLLASITLLLVAVLFSGHMNGTQRWFLLGPISIQPSEIAKLALIPFAAYQISRKLDRVNQRDLLLPIALGCGLVCGLILIQPDFGTAVLLASTVFFLLFLAGLSWRYVVGGFALAVPLLYALVIAVPYRRERFFAFLDPERDPLGSGFQALQSLIAIGSGGAFGLGAGQSLQKLWFLPHPESDFVYAIVCEELGMAGALFVIGLFGIVAWRGYVAGAKAPDAFGRYLAWGFTLVVVLQAFLNVSVALALLPTKGIPLPFISYGGSSLVVTMTACGVLLNLSQHG